MKTIQTNTSTATPAPLTVTSLLAAAELLKPIRDAMAEVQRCCLRDGVREPTVWLNERSYQRLRTIVPPMAAASGPWMRDGIAICIDNRLADNCMRKAGFPLDSDDSLSWLIEALGVKL